MTLAFSNARPLKVQTSLVCTFIALFVLRHSHKSPLVKVLALISALSIKYISKFMSTIDSLLAVMLWKIFHVIYAIYLYFMSMACAPN